MTAPNHPTNQPPNHSRDTYKIVPCHWSDKMLGLMHESHVPVVSIVSIQLHIILHSSIVLSRVTERCRYSSWPVSRFLGWLVRSFLPSFLPSFLHSFVLPWVRKPICYTNWIGPLEMHNWNPWTFLSTVVRSFVRSFTTDWLTETSFTCQMHLCVSYRSCLNRTQTRAQCKKTPCCAFRARKRVMSTYPAKQSKAKQSKARYLHKKRVSHTILKARSRLMRAVSVVRPSQWSLSIKSYDCTRLICLPTYLPTYLPTKNWEEKGTKYMRRWHNCSLCVVSADASCVLLPSAHANTSSPCEPKQNRKIEMLASRQQKKTHQKHYNCILSTLSCNTFEASLDT
jgi:hypothetical protein